jgi:hypothetical protein
MTSSAGDTTARQVHELLLSARPQSGNADLARAAELASSPQAGPQEISRKAFLAIQQTQQAMAEGASAADGEQLLLNAIRAAELWVKASQ